MSWQFFERLRLFQEESKIHKQELSERTLKELKDSLEKKLDGQHKLSKQEELVYDALKGGSFFFNFLAVLIESETNMFGFYSQCSLTR